MIIGQLLKKCHFWPILAKMGTPKNGKMSFLMIKTCLVSKNSNRNNFYDNRVSTDFPNWFSLTFR